MRDHAHFIRTALREGAQLRARMAASAANIDLVVKASALVVEALRNGNKVILFGNGGSAADAQHIAAELVGRLTVDRAPLAAIALTVDTSAITSIANDYGFAHVYERQLRAIGRRGDVAIAITTSGKSESVLRAVTAAREMGMRTIAMTGAGGHDFASTCDAGLIVPTSDTARIQEMHIALGHVICAIAQAEVCGVELPRAYGSKHITLEALIPIREELRSLGRSVVWTNGCFDVLHAGHVASLWSAKALGDVLVVGVNDDAYVRKTKGDGRPVHNLAQRIEMLSALEMVDFVVAFSEATPSAALGRLKPDIHCKGSDYAPPNGAPIPEADVVREYGGRIEFLPLIDGLSTSSIVGRLARSE